jgi:hypothetical protein
MKNKICTVIFLFFFTCISYSQTAINKDSIQIYFNEIKEATKHHFKLWNTDIYGQILFVNPEDRMLYANDKDTLGILKPDGNIFTGILPKEINIANTSIAWGGKVWAMIFLPLPDDKNEMLRLCTHELFHRAQSKLGFKISDEGNNHLDSKDGRIFLRLELTALKKALLSDSPNEEKKHLTNAFIFRKYRNSLFASSGTNENLLELNEGLAEFTGVIMGGLKKKALREQLAKDITDFFGVPTYVRSFPYRTTPAYGCLLYLTKKDWNLEVNSETNLTDYFIKNFTITIPENLADAVKVTENDYNYADILSEENSREEKIKEIISFYKNLFIDGPHFELRFERMSISFDTRNIMPLEKYGTVYPNMRVSDNWGILNVTDGALVSSGWDKVTVSIPLKTDMQNVSGKGWTLELKEGYTILKDDAGNYFLKKK